ncbi:hypothetical protein BO71DRAFT_405979 [Aspergillus ellipticus CBS 707.79]|uniref:Uncharacterized protein n=1 Tax=Aspergillus ellipticus CBS 707.79 TaxID=1448320 RepID=A0A319DM87_9EURO|nr:hypothetical protein BO71DRAFT_405979 [Aspergillus ellipticus CBS 707.79]
MAYTNILSADSYEGTVDGITIKWGPNAKTRLPTDASIFGVDAVAMKAATEHFAHVSAKRLDKTTAIILGSFHNTTTVTGTGEKKVARCHITLKLNPGGVKVHVNVDLPEGGPMEDTEWQGESVILKNTATSDPNLSVGDYLE